MWKAPIVALLSIWLVAMVFGSVAKFAGEPGAEHGELLGLKAKIEEIESGLETVEAKKGAQHEIRANLSRIGLEIDELIERETQRYRWDWWSDVLNPLLVLTFLICCIKGGVFSGGPSE